MSEVRPLFDSFSSWFDWVAAGKVKRPNVTSHSARHRRPVVIWSRYFGFPLVGLVVRGKVAVASTVL